MGPSSAAQEPSVEFGAVVAGGAGREVVFGDTLPRGDLLKRPNRLAPEVLGGLLRGHPLQRQTVGEYLEGWIEGPLKGSVAPKTYADYAWICRKHLIPEIGCLGLSKLTAEDLDRLYARKTAAGLGPRTVGSIHSTVRVALQRAAKKSLVPYNVARDAEPPSRGPKKERTTLSLAQVADFFKAAAEAESRFEALFIVAVLGPV
jgi:integrase